MAAGAVVRAWHRHVVSGDDPRLTTSFAAGLGFAMTLAVAAIVTHLRAQLSLTVDLGIFAGLVAMAGWWMTWIGSLITAGLAFLMLNGFAVDQYAVLHWHGRGDVVRLVVLFGCAVVATAVRELQLRHQSRTEDRRLTRELAELTGRSLTQGARRHA